MSYLNLTHCVCAPRVNKWSWFRDENQELTHRLYLQWKSLRLEVTEGVMVIPDRHQPLEDKMEGPPNPSLQLAQPTRVQMGVTPWKGRQVRAGERDNQWRSQTLLSIPEMCFRVCQTPNNRNLSRNQSLSQRHEERAPHLLPLPLPLEWIRSHQGNPAPPNRTPTQLQARSEGNSTYPRDKPLNRGLRRTLDPPVTLTHPLLANNRQCHPIQCQAPHTTPVWLTPYLQNRRVWSRTPHPVPYQWDPHPRSHTLSPLLWMGQYHPQQPLLVRSKEGHRTRWVKGQVQGWSGSHQGFYWSQRVGRAWPLSQRPELDVVGFTLGCHELDPIFLVFLQLWSVCWDMLSKSLHLIILWCDILEVEFIKVILLKWLGFYPSQSLLQITVSIFEGVQGRHCLRSGHPALWSDTSVWRGACWYTIHHCLSGIIRLSFKIRSCNETCRSFLFWNFRHKMTGKILHGECGPIVMASIDDLTW